MDKTHVWNLFRLYRNQVARFLLILIIGFAFSGSSLFAQKNLPNHDNKRLHFGISLGLNWSKFAVTHSDAFAFHDTVKLVNSTRSPGFNISIISNLHLTKRSDLRFIPGLTFAERDLVYSEDSFEGHDTTNIKTIESIILHFPVLYKYKSDRFFENFRFYVIGGARFDWDLASNSKARKATDIVKINNFDILAEYGVGLEFYFPLFIFSPQLKFSQGILNTHVPTENLRYSDVLGRLRSNYITLTLQFEG